MFSKHFGMTYTIGQLTWLVKDVVFFKVLFTKENTKRRRNKIIRASESRQTATSNLINLGKVNSWLNIKKLIKKMNQRAQVTFHVKCFNEFIWQRLNQSHFRYKLTLWCQTKRFSRRLNPYIRASIMTTLATQPEPLSLNDFTGVSYPV